MRRGWATIGVLVAGVAALAQDSPPEDAAPEIVETPSPGLKITLEPVVWYASPGGDLKMPGGGRLEKLSDVGLADPRLSPAGAVRVSGVDWDVTVEGFDYSIEGAGEAGPQIELGTVVLSPGDAFRSSMEFAAFQASLGYRFVDEHVKPLPGGEYTLDAAIDAIVGLRGYDMEFRVEDLADGGVTETEAFFVEPIVGVRLDATLYGDFHLDVTNTFGFIPGDSESDFSWAIQIAARWMPSEHVGVRLGYQALLFDLEDTSEGFEYRGGMLGLYAGLTLSF